MAVGPQQILIILLVVILLFGAKKLPALARSLGQSIGEFKKGRQELEDEAAAASAKSPESEKNESSS